MFIFACFIIFGLFYDMLNALKCLDYIFLIDQIFWFIFYKQIFIVIPY